MAAITNLDDEYPERLGLVPLPASQSWSDPATTGIPGSPPPANVEDALTELQSEIDLIGSTSGATPYYIAVGSNFTVPLYRQALYNHAITIDGTLTVDGLLIFVS